MSDYKIKVQNFSNALIKLKEALAVPSENPLKIDGCIKRFEFTYETAKKRWKKHYINWILIRKIQEKSSNSLGSRILLQVLICGIKCVPIEMIPLTSIIVLKQRK